MKILGISIINAFALLAIIGDIKRFATPARRVSYLGLNPGRRQSGTGKDIGLGIGSRDRRDLRSLLIQGAQAVLRHGSRSTPFTAMGLETFCAQRHQEYGHSRHCPENGGASLAPAHGQ